MLDEGFRSVAYLDTVGVPTIGYGSTKLLSHPVTLDTLPISKDGAREALRAGLYGAILDAAELAPTFWQLNDVRREVLVNMAYNLGRAGLGRFTRFLDAIRQADFDQAAHEMRDSLWYWQVKGRAERLAEAMRTGKFES